MSLDPPSIPQFSVIRIPVKLQGFTELKRFVVISHVCGHAFCLKTTSQTEAFKNSPNSVVIYEDGDCPLFQKKTVIDPRNQFPIPHSQLVENERDGEYENHGVMPPDFRERLVQAVQNSRVMESNKKKRLLSELGVK